jgi:hypothetical protein
MKVLHLTLKKKWFDMIASGEKKEEYRELKEYWNTRLNYGDLKVAKYEMYFLPKRFDAVTFVNGYQKNARSITVQWKDIKVATGNPGWGAEPGKEYFVIKLGKIIRQ